MRPFMIIPLIRGHSRPLYLYFLIFLQLIVNKCSLQKLLMAGFEPWSFGVGSDCYATTKPLLCMIIPFVVLRGFPNSFRLLLLLARLYDRSSSGGMLGSGPSWSPRWGAPGGPPTTKTARLNTVTKVHKLGCAVLAFDILSLNKLRVLQNLNF